MKTWKVWVWIGEAQLALEFKGTYSEVCVAAVKVAHNLGATFDFNIEEMK